MKANTVKGTNDYLPKDAALRDFLQESILKTYQSHGFERIMTPAIEDAQNLDKSDGGDNLNLIFKILKRGDKLKEAIESGNFDELSDLGLRYDLTLPLSRYYANNKENLVLPFKCIQIDKVYRAERPQKGRLRELVQCDIDILGSDSVDCEIELIAVTAKAILNIGLKNFKVKINDRRILKSVLLSLGFEEDQLDSVCITFDKLEKIGLNGIKDELTQKGFANAHIDNLLSLLSQLPITTGKLEEICPDKEVLRKLETIITSVQTLAKGEYSIEFDISLVRGQGYYTGTVFEIEVEGFKGSVAGGGRYDNLIGKFTNTTVPAVGFSIGFERIYVILSENGFAIPDKKKKVAVLYQDDFLNSFVQASLLQSDYDVAIFEKPKKTGKFLNKLQESGYYGFLICGEEQQLNIFNQ